MCARARPLARLRFVRPLAIHIQHVDVSPHLGSAARMAVFSQLYHGGALACAGEHVPGGDHYEVGTVNGAMESAQRAVQRWYPAAVPGELRRLSSAWKGGSHTAVARL